MHPLLSASVFDQARAIAAGEITSRQLTELTTERIRIVNPRVNAIITEDYERALDDAIRCDHERSQGHLRGSLHGVPMTIKDSHDTADIATSWGVADRAYRVPKENSTAVARLKQAGAVVLAKSSTPPLTLSFSTNNGLIGRTENPHRLGFSPGGSSGGAAALLAAGCTALELGSDLGGSIRVPASWCGVAGLKPTAGRVPRTGHAIGFGGALDHFGTIGPMSRYARDLMAALELLAGPDGHDPSIASASFLPAPTRPLRVAAFFDTPMSTVLPDVADVLHAGTTRLADRGYDVVWTMPPMWPDAWCLATLGLFAFLPATTGPLVPDEATPDGVGPFRHVIGAIDDYHRLSEPLKALSSGHGPLSASETESVIRLIRETQREFAEFIQDFDAVICPASASAAPPHHAVDGLFFQFGNPVNLFGAPATVVRAGETKDGLPVGLQVITPMWCEAQSVAIAEHLEVPGPLALAKPLSGVIVVAGETGPLELQRLAGQHGAVAVPVGSDESTLLRNIVGLVGTGRAVVTNAPGQAILEWGRAFDVPVSIVNTPDIK
jgi:amidase